MLSALTRSFGGGPVGVSTLAVAVGEEAATVEEVIYEQANAHGQKVQAAGNNMAQTDSAVGSSWA